MSPKNPFHKLNPSLTRRIFLVFLAIVLLLNVWTLFKETKKIMKAQSRGGYSFAGTRFAGLENVFQNVDVAGYMTDKNLDDTVPAMQFSQAQYVLAPTLLDLNNADHDYLLFDCRSDAIALLKIKEIGAIPLKKNQFGIILARKPGIK